MNQVPHITIEQIAAIYPHESAETHKEILTRCNTEISAYSKKQATEQYITAEAARKLGAGKAEYSLDGDDWHVCGFGCEYAKFGTFSKNEYKYRAIKQEPVEPTCQIRNEDTGVTETMTREAAKLLQAETKDVCDWFNSLGVACDDGFNFDGNYIYRYKPKANLVKLDGELMTREAAIAKWESSKDKCDIYHKSVNNQNWWHVGRTPAFDTHNNDGAFGEYQLRDKPLKQVSWDSVPVGVAVKHNAYQNTYKFICATPTQLWVTEEGNAPELLFTEYVELAPASKQPWIFWGGGACPVPEGFAFEVTCRSGAVREQEEVSDWTHTGHAGDIIAYRITGLVEG